MRSIISLILSVIIFVVVIALVWILVPLIFGLLGVGGNIVKVTQILVVLLVLYGGFSTYPRWPQL